MVNKCGSCDLPIKKKTDITAQCQACKESYHESCSGLSNSDFAIISKKSALKWFCKTCDTQVTDLLTNFEKFKKMNAELKSIRDDIDRKMSDFEVRLRACEQIEKNQQIESTIKKVVQQSIPSVASKSETELIEKKKCNLIFFKIPESNSENVETRIKHDYDCMKQVIGEQNTDPTDIVNIFRVGKKNEDGRARPLIVKYHDVKIKQKYCNMAFGKNLKLRANNEIIDIAVSHDKTIKQREESKKRFEQNKVRNKNDAENKSDSQEEDEENFQDARTAPKPTWASVLKNMR